MINANPCNSKRITSVSLYSPKLSLYSSNGKHRMKAFHLLFIAAYAYQSYWCISTIGAPYRQFLEKAEREGFEGTF